MKLSQTKKYIEAHGFQAWVNGEVVSFWVPWVDPATFLVGYALVSVATLREAHKALGY
jgi:hypothetical protein